MNELQTYLSLHPPLGCLPRGGANLGRFLFGAHRRRHGGANLCMFVFARGEEISIFGVMHAPLQSISFFCAHPP